MVTTKINYVAYVATSIDGRISKNNNAALDWTSNEDWDFLQVSLKKMDAVVVGHNTYKVSSERLKRRNTIVLTSKVKEFRSEGSIVFLNPQKIDLRKFIKNKKYKNIAILGGGQVYDYCLRHGMIDKLLVTIEPYIFTTGVPMFNGKIFKKYKFKLLNVKKLNKKGTLLLKYKNAN